MYKSISLSEFSEKHTTNPVNLIDVREKDEYANGHVPGAVNMPLSELAGTFDQLDKDTEYHIICHSGARSAKASQFLDQQGLDVVNVEGGTMSWPNELEK